MSYASITFSDAAPPIQLPANADRYLTGDFRSAETSGQSPEHPGGGAVQPGRELHPARHVDHIPAVLGRRHDGPRDPLGRDRGGGRPAVGPPAPVEERRV